MSLLLLSPGSQSGLTRSLVPAPPVHRRLPPEAAQMRGARQDGTDGVRLREVVLPLCGAGGVEGRETSSLIWELGHFSEGDAPGAPWVTWQERWSARERILRTLQKGDVRAVVLESLYHPLDVNAVPACWSIAIIVLIGA